MAERSGSDRAGAGASARVVAIIVHHRGRRLLERCLTTLIASRGVDLDVVIVSNACDEPLPDLALEHPRLHVVTSQRAIGFSEANNLGAAWAAERLERPPFLFFVNNDTIVEEATVERLVSAVLSTERCAIAGPQLMIWGAQGVLNSLGLQVTVDGQAWDEGIGRPLSEYGETPPVRDVLAVTGAALMIRSDVFDELGRWSELYGFYFEDIDLCLRVRSHGWRVVVARDAVMSHAISATAARGSDLKLQLSWRNRFLLTAVHWPWTLLVRTVPRTLLGELRLAWRRGRARCWADVRLQIRSWLGALRRWPSTLAERRLRGRSREWVTELRPRGSVPVIVLPELPEEAREVAAPDSP